MTVERDRGRKLKRALLVRYDPNGDLVCIKPTVCASRFGTARGACRHVVSHEQVNQCLAQMAGELEMIPDETTGPN